MKKVRNILLEEKIIEDELHHFLLLFHSKFENENYFTSYDEFLYTNTKNKYSLFGFLDDSFKNENDSFVFLMEYPDTSCYFYFQQNINPLQAEPNSEVGFTQISTTCSSITITFSGLTKFNDTCSYLDGFIPSDENEPDYWHYALGQRCTWGLLGENQIPAYTTSENITEVNLFIEINSVSVLAKFQTFYSCGEKVSHINPSMCYVLIALAH